MNKITDYFTKQQNALSSNIKKPIDSYFQTESKVINDNEERQFLSFESEQKSQEKSIGINVYTDGSCTHNGSKYAKAGMGIFFGENDPRNVSRRIDGKQTNNTAELKAILEVFRILEKEIKQQCKINIYTDSQYSIWCCGSYGRRMRGQNYQDKNKKTGKIQDIPNKELVKQAVELFSTNYNVRLIKVEAHSGKQDIHSLGNEQADLLAYLSISNGKTERLNNKRIYIYVPFHMKDQVKQEGAKWDYKKKKWYYMDSLSQESQQKIHKILNNKIQLSK